MSTSQRFQAYSFYIGKAIRGMGFICCVEVVQFSEGLLLEVSL